MKTVFITGEHWHIDEQSIMAAIEHVYKTKGIDMEDDFVTSNAPGSETVAAGLLKQIGVTVRTVANDFEPDVMIVMASSDRQGYGHDQMMRQWERPKPVFPFLVVKP